MGLLVMQVAGRMAREGGPRAELGGAGCWIAMGLVVLGTLVAALVEKGVL